MDIDKFIKKYFKEDRKALVIKQAEKMMLPLLEVA